jgi:diadenosine tetraphosphate (Ap4A) HIT family hydrolase
VKWPASFYAARRGEGCAICQEGRPDEVRSGLRIFTGRVSDAYLQRANIQRGYTIVAWRGRHVAEPTELSPTDAAAYWLEVLRVARALEGHLKPVKMNYNVLGNSVPHLHTHLIPRYADDPRPGWPFPFPEHDPSPIDDGILLSDVEALRTLLS